jgi:hypothetical protein
VSETHKRRDAAIGVELRHFSDVNNYSSRPEDDRYRAQSQKQRGKAKVCFVNTQGIGDARGAAGGTSVRRRRKKDI